MRAFDAFEPRCHAGRLPLGLSAIKFWTRTKFKGTAALKEKINPTRVPIEEKESFRWLENMRQSIALFGDPARCIHVGDRESDIYELFCTAHELGTHFVVRTCVDRLAGDGEHTIAAEMNEEEISGLHEVEVRDAKGKPETVAVEIKYRRIHVLPPIGKQKRYPALDLTVLYAQEREETKASTKDRLEARAFPRRRHREARLVRHALEDRDLPQDPEIRLQSRRGTAANCRAPREAHCCLLHPGLAGVLDDHDQPLTAAR